jgi:FkbM family methyltransferase
MSSRALGAIRRIGGHPAILPFTARLLCARTVRESPVFLAREMLQRSGAYSYRLRDSGVQVTIRHQGIDAATLGEVFYHRYYEPPPDIAEAIGEPLQILDLGANIGLFGAFAAARWPQSRIVGYEPDPANSALHERTIEANGLGYRWRLERAAAGRTDGQVRFAAGLDVASHVLEREAPEDQATIVVAQRDAMQQIADADILKLDIEGGEWDILLDPRFAAGPPRAVVLEYHPLPSPGGDPRATVEKALEAAGLQTASIWHAADGHGMLWGWRR